MNLETGLWLAAVIGFGVLETATTGLVCVWFAVGSVAGLIAAACGVGFWTQMGLFAAVSAIALAVTRPLVRKIRNRQFIPTNADRVLGAEAVVTETIDNTAGTGAVYVDGKTWTARGAGGGAIPAGSRVRVETMEGVKLLVRPLAEAERESPKV